ncbi:MAG: GatB/YqeY domain-containing protein [Elusimicrobiota bacterium]|jgi:uncharacterized protein YqeY|nr:GatB/YqeY domain-containing protein [Elusimicrobiota bacterium]
MESLKTIKILKNDLTAFMKAKDLDKLNVIRGILNEINIRDMKNIKITEDEIVKVLRSEIKKRKESIEIFEKAKRQDLIEKESAEICVIEKYLPAELSDEELLKIVKVVVETSSDKSFGTVMKSAISAVNGKADGKKVSAVVKQVLENK